MQNMKCIKVDPTILIAFLRVLVAQANVLIGGW